MHATPRQRALKLAPCAWAATVILASSAAAHGGPPVIEGSLAADDSGPFLVELSEGFALREAGAWSFVCPAVFGADIPPPSASLGAEALFAGRSELYRIDAQKTASAAGHPDLAGPRVLAMTALDDSLIALRLREAGASGGMGTEVVRLSGDTVMTLFQDAEYWSTLTALPGGDSGASQLWLARLTGEGLEVLGLELDGTVIDRQLAALPLQALSIKLRVAGEHVFGHVVENGGYTLLHVATRGESPFPPAIVASATLPIAGPALRGDDVLYMRDGELLAFTPDASLPSSSPLGTAPLTCLTDAYACSASGQLHDAAEVERVGSIAAATPLFDLARLGPPALMPEAADQRDACTLQWLVFRADLVRVGITPREGGADAGQGTVDAGEADAAVPDAARPDAATAEPPPPASGESSGCSVHGPRAHGATQWPALLGLVLLMLGARVARAGNRCPRPRIGRHRTLCYRPPRSGS